MIISGNIFRKVLRDNKFSFNFDASFDSCTGVSEMGFSGQGKTFKFSFISGKMYDHEGRYAYSYIPNSQVNIESNFSGVYYDYFINDNRVIFSGSKNDFYAERFYVNTTGANIDSTITIKALKPSLDLHTNSVFITGSNITGYLTSSAPSGLQVLSGEFEDGSTFYFKSFPTGVISASSSGQVLIGQNVTGVGDFYSNYTIHTSAGDYTDYLQISGIETPYLNYVFELSDGLNTLDTISNITLQSGVNKNGEVILNYGYNTNDVSLVPASLPLDISLNYYSGATGYFGQITDVDIVNGGSGYLSPPTIIFSGGGGSLASGTAILGTTSVDYDKVIDVQMTSFGSGYTSTPTVLFSGGTGIINNNYPGVASGLAQTSFYTKSFTGSFNLFTGTDFNYLNYRSNNYVSGFNYKKNNFSLPTYSYVNVKVSYDTSFDNYPLVAKLSISGANNNIIERYITGFK